VLYNSLFINQPNIRCCTIHTLIASLNKSINRERVRAEVLTRANMKSFKLVRDVTLCSLVESFQRFGESAVFVLWVEDAGSRFL
jgi:hypothetical protein